MNDSKVAGFVVCDLKGRVVVAGPTIDVAERRLRSIGAMPHRASVRSATAAELEALADDAAIVARSLTYGVKLHLARTDARDFGNDLAARPMPVESIDSPDRSRTTLAKRTTPARYWSRVNFPRSISGTVARAGAVPTGRCGRTRRTLRSRDACIRERTVRNDEAAYLNRLTIP